MIRVSRKPRQGNEPARAKRQGQPVFPGEGGGYLRPDLSGEGGGAGKGHPPENFDPSTDQIGQGKNLRQVLSSASAYTEALLWIRDMTGALIPFHYNPAQREVNLQKQYAVQRGRPMRFLIAKARRMGITTKEQADSFALCATRQGQQAVTLADIAGKSKRIFRIATTFYENLPKALQPKRKHESTQVLNFEEMGSSFFIGTAGATTFGRGDTLQRVHGSEVAYWLKSRGYDYDEIDLLISGLTEAARMGEVVLESTSNGNFGWWHDACMEAHTSPDQTEWTLIFLPYYIDPTLQDSVDPYLKEEILDTLTDHEKFLIHDLRRSLDTNPHADRWFTTLPHLTSTGLPLSTIAWRRRMRATRSLRRLFDQEYPETLEISFLASADCYFDSSLLNELVHDLQPPIHSIPEEGVDIWKDPVPGHRYVGGMDVAEGVRNGNFSTLCIIDHETGEQVMRYRARIRPKEHARRAVAWAKRYNDALLACEREGIGGECVRYLYNEMQWHNLYFDSNISSRTRRASREIGWSTNGLTRPVMLDDLRDAMDTRQIKVNDPVFIQECRTFEKSDRTQGRDPIYEARAGQKDDVLFGWAIAWGARAKGVMSPQVVVL